MNVAEEKTFVADLAHRSGKTRKTDVSRDAITLVVTALRNGTTVDEMVIVASNLDFQSLLGAYKYIAQQLMKARKSWESLQNHTGGKLEKHLHEVAKLLPLTADRLFHTSDNKAAFTMVLSNETQMVHETQRAYDAVRDEVAGGNLRGAELFAARNRLYHPDRECLLTASHFLPRNVGELSPPRLAMLLDERGEQLDETIQVRPARTRQN